MKTKPTLLTAALATAFASSLVANDASAWIPRETNSTPACLISDGPFRVFEHGHIDVVLHTAACPAAVGGINDLDFDGLVDTETCDTLGVQTFSVVAAMMDIHDAINNIVGTDIDLQLTVTTAPFTFATAEGDTTPTIHVGFAVDTAVTGGAAQVITPTPSTGCTFPEQHMVIRDQSIPGTNWTWSEPGPLGLIWYLAGQINAGARSFRTVYMHEMMHALGLRHVDETYSMLNNQDRPYFPILNEQIQPLPDEIGALRIFYPGPGNSTDMMLTNTWVDVNAVPGPVASNCSQSVPTPQLFNCNPSLGAAWADRFSGTTSGLTCGRQDPDGIPTCGQDDGVAGSTTVCPGQDLRAEVTIANPGTRDLDLDLELWFSSDDVWSFGDVRSPTIRSSSVDAADSINRHKQYVVPEIDPGTYTLLSRVIGEDLNGTTVSDWIPLRGGVTVVECEPRRIIGREFIPFPRPPRFPEIPELPEIDPIPLPKPGKGPVISTGVHPIVPECAEVLAVKTSDKTRLE